MIIVYISRCDFSSCRNLRNAAFPRYFGSGPLFSIILAASNKSLYFTLYFFSTQEKKAMSIPLPALSPAETSYIVTSLAHPSYPTRNDARPLFASRPIQISYGVFPQANGSSQVKLGETEVVCGIKLEVIDITGQQIKDQEKWRTKVEVDV